MKKIKIIRNNIRYIWRWLTSPIFRSNEGAREFQEAVDRMRDEMNYNIKNRVSLPFQPEIITTIEGKKFYEKHFPEYFKNLEGWEDMRMDFERMFAKALGYAIQGGTSGKYAGQILQMKEGIWNLLEAQKAQFREKIENRKKNIKSIDEESQFGYNQALDDLLTDL